MFFRSLNLMVEICSKFDFEKKIKGVVISEEQIKSAVVELGQKLDAIYDGTPILFIGILNGSFVFMSDVCRSVSVPCEIAFMCAKSYYSGTVSTGNVNITMDVNRDLSKYHVVVLEDIIDTGRTLSEVVKILKSRSPKSLRVVTLLDKPSRRVVDFNADIALFTIPDTFVIGYGLDCAELYRNLPYIAEYNCEE